MTNDLEVERFEIGAPHFFMLSMIMTVFAGIAEFEWDLIREPTGAGRVAAKERGVCFGRPKRMNQEQKLLAKRLLQEDKSVREISKTFNRHLSKLYCHGELLGRFVARILMY